MYVINFAKKILFIRKNVNINKNLIVAFATVMRDSTTIPILKDFHFRNAKCCCYYEKRFFLKKNNNFMAPFYGKIHPLEDCRDTLEKQLAFNHQVPRNYWHILLDI